MAEFYGLPGLGAHLEPGGTIARRAMGENLAEAFNLGAVFASVRSIGAADQDEALALHTEAIIEVIIDAAADAVLGQGARAATNGRQATQRGADPENTVPGLAAVVDR